MPLNELHNHKRNVNPKADLKSRQRQMLIQSLDINGGKNLDSIKISIQVSVTVFPIKVFDPPVVHFVITFHLFTLVQASDLHVDGDQSGTRVLSMAEDTVRTCGTAAETPSALLSWVTPIMKAAPVVKPAMTG